MVKLKANPSWGMKTASFLGVAMPAGDGDWTVEGDLVFRSDLLGQHAGIFVGIPDSAVTLSLGRLAGEQGVEFNIGLINNVANRCELTPLVTYSTGIAVRLRMAKIGDNLWGFFSVDSGGSWEQAGVLPAPTDNPASFGIFLEDRNTYENETRIADPSVITNGEAVFSSLGYSAGADDRLLAAIPRVYLNVKLKNVEPQKQTKVGGVLYGKMHERLFRFGMDGGTLKRLDVSWAKPLPWAEIPKTAALVPGGETGWVDVSEIFAVPRTQSVLALSFFQDELGQAAGQDLGNVGLADVEVCFATAPSKDAVVKTIQWRAEYPTLGMLLPRNAGGLAEWGGEVRTLDEYASSIHCKLDQMGAKPLKPSAIWSAACYSLGYWGCLYSPAGQAEMSSIAEYFGAHTPYVLFNPVVTKDPWADDFAEKVEELVAGAKVPAEEGVCYVKLGDEPHIVQIGHLADSHNGLTLYRRWLAGHLANPSEVGFDCWDDVLPLERKDVETKEQARLYWLTVWFLQEATADMFRVYRDAFHRRWDGQIMIGTDAYWSGFDSTPDYFIEAKLPAFDVSSHHYGSGDTVGARQTNADYFVADMFRSAKKFGNIERQGVLWFVCRIANAEGVLLSGISALNRGTTFFHLYGMGPRAAGWEWFLDDQWKTEAMAAAATTMEVANRYAPYLLSGGSHNQAEVALVLSRSSVVWADVADDQMVRIFGHDSAKELAGERRTDASVGHVSGWACERRMIHTALQ
ncbi:MAG: hypothetical protein JW808_07990, partial [Victivallales bacterium]|nr:hypothetical protein [Victivallales bacterium]